MSSELVLNTLGVHGGRWKRYPAYRDSGVEWLEEVPEGWEVMKLKQFSKLITKGTTPMTIGKGFVNDGITFVKVENINNNFSIDTSNCNYIDEETDLLLNRSRLIDRDILIAIAGAIGRVAIVDRNILPANTNQAVGIIRLYNNLINEKFLLYFLGSANVNQFYILNTVQSAQANLSLGNISNIKLTSPPLHEQQAIAAFLDRKTERIDTLIEKKERQIELLQEKRAALISHSVTKGLDPDVKMKDSGVEWLGEVPEHWEMLALKRLASLKSGESITVESIDKDGDYPVFGGNGLRGYTTTFTHDGNYVLIGRQGALCGNINYAQGQFWASEHAVVVSPIGPVETKWLGELLRAMNLNQYSVSAAQPGLSVEMVSNLSIPQPPLQEQSTIATFLNRKTGHIDMLTTKVYESISKLREYRTALISAAVTGKIDVRNKET